MDCHKLKEECNCDHCRNIKEQIEQAGILWKQLNEKNKTTQKIN